ncbi:fructosamine kinase family protein [Candidatus Sumerlaeota bacterium]|nr:fructosamine kinase family protein [Candidatus Sumerlaeota bacterium]
MFDELLKAAVEQLITGATGQAARIVDDVSCGGGCINDARTLLLADERKFFLKSNAAPLTEMFQREAEGLNALADVEQIRVPRALGAGGGSNSNSGAIPHIVIEHIETGRPGPGFMEDFGRRFALLHRHSQGTRFGSEHDNYIGATPQPNGWRESWADFWREHRLGYQLQLARQNGHCDSRMRRLGDRLMERLPELIGLNEPPCLLHGDLWSGNFLCASDDAPVLIDPAAYYGQREADLAMTMLFGGFSPAFYEAYQEVWPLANGWWNRIEIYRLYHLMNHLNLFGVSYRNECMDILQRYGG